MNIDSYILLGHEFLNFLKLIEVIFFAIFGSRTFEMFWGKAALFPSFHYQYGRKLSGHVTWKHMKPLALEFLK